MSKSFYEFFAGGGMVRAGLGAGWECLLANDNDPKKAKTYCRNWGDRVLVVGNIAGLGAADLPGSPDLVWASFPCQDLSVAGNGAGLGGPRSGAFWSLIAQLRRLKDQGRASPLIALENVPRTSTSNNGKDFAAICKVVMGLGYAMGAIVMDAARFLPQSRPRLFMIAVRDDVAMPPALTAASPQAPWHTDAVTGAYMRLPPKLQAKWRWWTMPEPPARKIMLADIIDDDLPARHWDSHLKTLKLLLKMTEANLQKVAAAKAAGGRAVGTVYKRTRVEHGQKFSRAEIRFDGLAGCLRTPGGGSSRQQVLVIENDIIRSRLVSPRETARLMGLAETYVLPDRATDAYHLTGDGVAVPVVRYIAQHLFEPLVKRSSAPVIGVNLPAATLRRRGRA